MTPPAVVRVRTCRTPPTARATTGRGPMETIGLCAAPEPADTAGLPCPSERGPVVCGAYAVPVPCATPAATFEEAVTDGERAAPAPPALPVFAPPPADAVGPYADPAPCATPPAVA